METDYFFISQYDTKSKMEDVSIRHENSFQLQISGLNTYVIESSNDNIVWQDKDTFLLFSGYIINDIKNISIKEFIKLATSSLDNKVSWLKSTTGYFSLVVINKKTDEIFIARDKYGCKPLYYSKNSNGQLELSNSLKPFNKEMFSFDPIGLYESIYYRWLSGTQTLDKNIAQLPAAFYGIITPETVSLVQYWLWHDLSKATNINYNLTTEQSVEATARYLDEYFKIISPQVNKVLIPLSGGVDSSVLAAKAKQHLGDKCIAGIIEFENDSPELDMAIYFAKTLDMPYKIIKYSDQEVLNDCKKLVGDLEQLPRHYSSIPFGKLLNSFDDIDAVIYGEPGDTYFGSNTIKRLLKRISRMNYVQKVPKFFTGKLVKKIIPNISTKAESLQNETVYKVIHEADKIIFNKADNQVIDALNPQLLHQLDIDEQLPLEDDNFFKSLSKSQKLSWIKTYMMITDIPDHLVTADKLIHNKKVKLLTPLTYSKIEQLSWQLSQQDYLGGDHVKTVLRELGCKYYSRSSMYAPKFGFDTPKERWLNLLNNQIKQKLTNGNLFTKSYLPKKLMNSFDEFSIEMKWTLYHLENYLEHYAKFK